MAARRKYISPPIPLPSPEKIRASGRAVIEFMGVDQAGPSFEARVFLNNPDAGSDTPMTPENGYAGSFHVYGYGLSPSGQPNQPAGGAGNRSARLPMHRSIVATDAVRRAASQGPTATVTVVPVLPGMQAGSSDEDEIFDKLGDILTMDQVSIHTDGSAGTDAG